jgi:hypothetical protein
MYRLPVLIGTAALAVMAVGATTLAVGLPGTRPATQSASVPADGHRTAVLDVASGTTLLTVRVADLGGAGGTLLRVRTPADAPVHPQVSTSGADTTRRSGNKEAVQLTLAGSQIIDLTLPRPRATVPVLLAGGASLFLLRAPAGVPVRVTAAGGAGTVSLDGAEHTGVAGGSVFAAANWGAAGPRYNVTASAGAAVIAIGRWRG